MLRRLRERVTFQRRSEVSDGAGGTRGDWYDLMKSRAAEISPRAAGGANAEQVIAQRLQGVMLFDVWIRGDPETLLLTTDDRCIEIPHRGRPVRVFNIRAITNPDMKRIWLVLTCEQGVASG